MIDISEMIDDPLSDQIGQSIASIKKLKKWTSEKYKAK